jgi:hypothetical protein
MALGDLHLRDVQLQHADGINAQDRPMCARRESVMFEARALSAAELTVVCD